MAYFKIFKKEKFILKHGEFLITKSNSLIDMLEKIITITFIIENSHL